MAIPIKAVRGTPANMPKMKQYAALLLLAAAALAGCDMVDTMKEGFTHSQEVAADLEKSLGAKAQVGFNWNNGVLSNVSVTFERYPQGQTFAQISAASKLAIANRFKQKPRQVVIGFIADGD